MLVTARPAHGDLLVEIAAGAHPGQFDHPAELHLAPAAPCLRPAQRGDERVGLIPQLLGGLPGKLHLLGQRSLRGLPGRLTLAELRLDPGKRLPERLDELLDRVPAGVELAGRAEVGRPQPDLADLEQSLLADVKRLGGQCLEPLGQVAIDQCGLLVRGTRSLIRGPGLSGEIGDGAGQAGSCEQESDDGAEQHADTDSGQQRGSVHIGLCFQPALTVPLSDTRARWRMACSAPIASMSANIAEPP